MWTQEGQNSVGRFVFLHLAPGSVFAYYFQHRYGLDVSYAFGLLNPAAPACGVRGGWNCTWASHFSEVAFVFGVSARSPTLPFTAGEAALHREMMARWAGFAQTGVPQTAGSSCQR